MTPPGFRHVEVGREFDVAVPLATQPLIRGRAAAIDHPRALILIMLRLKPQQSIEAATTALHVMQPDILEDTASQLPAHLAEPFILVPASAGTSGAAGPGLRQQYQRPLMAMLVLVGRPADRVREPRQSARARDDSPPRSSVRGALGASRWRLARQWLVESLVLDVTGAGRGLLVAASGSRVFVGQLWNPQPSVALDVSFDWIVLAYTTALTIATVVLFGTIPALRATRAAPLDALKATGVDARTLGGGSRFGGHGASSEMAFREPVVRGGWEQQRLVRCTGTKRYRHTLNTYYDRHAFLPRRLLANVRGRTTRARGCLGGSSWSARRVRG